VARLSELDSKSKVNLHIVGKFLKALTDDDGQCVVNASHEKDLKMIALNRTVITTIKVAWKGLGISKWHLYSLMWVHHYIS